MSLVDKNANKEYHKRYYQNNKQKWVDAEIRKRENPEFLSKQAESNKSWRERKKEHIQNYWLVKKYGITKQDYERILLSQRSKCAICDTSDWKGKHGVPHVDHCHKTGTVRGLLCNNCNTGLGSLQDSVDILKSALKYLKKYEQNIYL